MDKPIFSGIGGELRFRIDVTAVAAPATGVNRAFFARTATSAATRFGQAAAGAAASGAGEVAASTRSAPQAVAATGLRGRRRKGLVSSTKNAPLLARALSTVYVLNEDELINL